MPDSTLGLTVRHIKMSEWTLQEFIFRRPEIGEKEVQVIIKGRI